MNEVLIYMSRVEKVDNSLALVVSKFQPQGQPKPKTEQKSHKEAERELERPSGKSVEEMMANITKIKMEREKRFEQVYSRKRKFNEHEKNNEPIRAIPLKTLLPGEKFPGYLMLMCLMNLKCKILMNQSILTLMNPKLMQ